jgi:hypothetical protein
MKKDMMLARRIRGDRNHDLKGPTSLQNKQFVVPGEVFYSLPYRTDKKGLGQLKNYVAPEKSSSSGQQVKE